MKKLFAGLLALMLLASCSSTGINQIKLDIAEKVRDKSYSELSAEFKDFDASMNCEAEAKSHSEYLYSTTVRILKANETNKSLAPVAQTVCTFIAREGLPVLLERPGTSSQCLRKMGSDKLVKVSGSICSNIMF